MREHKKVGGDIPSRVDNVTTGLAVVVHRVDGSQQQLLLRVWQHHEVLFGLVGLDTRILCNDTRSRARRI